MAKYSRLVLLPPCVRGLASSININQFLIIYYIHTIHVCSFCCRCFVYGIGGTAGGSTGLVPAGMARPKLYSVEKYHSSRKGEGDAEIIDMYRYV